MRETGVRLDGWYEGALWQQRNDGGGCVSMCKKIGNSGSETLHTVRREVAALPLHIVRPEVGALPLHIVRREVGALPHFIIGREVVELTGD